MVMVVMLLAGSFNRVSAAASRAARRDAVSGRRSAIAKGGLAVLKGDGVPKRAKPSSRSSTCVNPVGCRGSRAVMVTLSS
jgi:hypothetical protein